MSLLTAMRQVTMQAALASLRHLLVSAVENLSLRMRGLSDNQLRIVFPLVGFVLR